MKLPERYFLEIPVKIGPISDDGAAWVMGYDERGQSWLGDTIFTDGEKVTGFGHHSKFVLHTKGWSWVAFLVWAKAKGIEVIPGA